MFDINILLRIISIPYKIIIRTRTAGKRKREIRTIYALDNDSFSHAFSLKNEIVRS